MAVTSNGREDPLVSVIVPCWNVRDYIRETVDSLLAQTYTKIEILLLDDASTDGTGRILDDYAKKDRRCRVFHLPHQGVAAMRNAGIERAQGEYIAFVDSDDAAAPDYIRDLAAAMTGGVGLAAADYQEFASALPTSGKGTGGVRILSSHDAIRGAYLSEVHSLNWVVWGKLYRRSLFTGEDHQEPVLFPEGKIHEDVAVLYQVFYRARSVALVDRVLYYYRGRKDSIMKKPFGREHLEVFAYTRQSIQFFQKHGEDDLMDLAANYHVRIYLGFLLRARQEGILTREEEKKYLQALKADLTAYVDPGHLPLWKKLAFHLAADFPADGILRRVGIGYRS